MKRMLVFLMMLAALALGRKAPGEETAPANIQIVSEPGVQIYLDDALKGETNEAQGGLILHNLAPGNHTLQAVKPGFPPRAKSVTLTPGQTQVLNLSPFVAAPAAAAGPAPAEPPPAEAPAGDGRTSLAVYPIKPAGTDAALAQAMTALLTSKLTPSPKLRVLEEAMLKTVIERQGLNASDACDDSSCQVDIGKLVKAQKLVTGNLVKFGNKYILSLKLIDIQSGTTDFSTEDKCSCSEDQLDGLVAVAAVKLRNHFGEDLPVPEIEAAPAEAVPAPAPASSVAPAPTSAFGPIPPGKARLFMYWKENTIPMQNFVGIPIDRKMVSQFGHHQECVILDLDAGSHWLGYRAGEGADLAAVAGASYYAEMTTTGKALIHWAFSIVPETQAAPWLSSCHQPATNRFGKTMKK